MRIFRKQISSASFETLRIKWFAFCFLIFFYINLSENHHAEFDDNLLVKPFANRHNNHCRELHCRGQEYISDGDRPDEEDWETQEHREHDWMLDIV